MSVQHGGFGDVDGVVPKLQSEPGRNLLLLGVELVLPCSCCLYCPYS